MPSSGLSKNIFNKHIIKTNLINLQIASTIYAPQKDVLRNYQKESRK